jgi:hypothetical protein
MQSDPQDPMPTSPPLYKEILVGIMVGGMLGPLIGWFIGTFATFFAVVAMDIDTSNMRGMKASAFMGGLIGIPFGLATGLLIGLPLRVSSRFVYLLKDHWIGGAVGTLMGSLCGYVILRNWYPSSGSLIYVEALCMVVGAVVGTITVIAKPKWL